GPVAVATEVDAGEDDLAVALRDAALDLTEHGLCRTATRRPADERDDAEAARERAAVLHLDEGADAIEPGVGLDATDRAEVAGERLGGPLAPPRAARGVVGKSGKGIADEVGAAAGDVDGPMRARGPRGLLA